MKEITVLMFCIAIITLSPLAAKDIPSKIEGSKAVESKCKTREGEEGVCKPFNKCFPIVGIAILIKSDLFSSNSQLQEDILEASTRCDPSNSNNSNSTAGDIICCVSHVPNTKVGDVITIEQDLKTEGIANVTLAVAVPDDTGGPYVVNPDPGTPNPHSYPWMAALIRRDKQNKHFCGGSLIDNRHILTAAHCLLAFKRSADVKNLGIFLGSHNLGVPEPSRRSYEIEKIFKHSGYSDKTYKDDIALLRLSKPVEVSDKIKPINLNRGTVSRLDDGSVQATLSGWGKTCAHCEPSTILRHGNMRMWKNSECQTKYDKVPSAIRHAVPKIQPTMVCAGSPGVDACQGDSGGPIFLNSGGYTQLGIVSWGIGCGQYPGVYTRVDKYVAWIDKNRNWKLT